MLKSKVVNINIGCGSRITKGYINFDSSFSVRLKKLPNFVIKFLYIFKIIARQHFEYIKFLKDHNVKYCDARIKIPLKNETVDNVYSSHTFEHLRYKDGDKFLNECVRVLKVGGGIRLVVPNLRLNIEEYIEDKDADNFFFNLGIFHDSHIKFNKFKNFIRNFINDGVGHKHMYDENSIKKKLIKNGFKDPKIIFAGQTSLKNLGELDLNERNDAKSKSIYVEAHK
tara:strand:+ start:252 stop:929 length:678 start_codon:yes stop_codon:yes gene_type:complete